MLGEPTFVDTNVLVYAYDADAGDKHQAARAHLQALWEDGSGLMSTQVLQGFSMMTVTRKLIRPLPVRTARDVIGTYGAWPVHRPDVDDVVASELEERHQLSFWVALIIVSARRSGAQALLTEDLQDGQRFDGLEVVSPFAAVPPRRKATSPR